MVKPVSDVILFPVYLTRDMARIARKKSPSAKGHGDCLAMITKSWRIYSILRYSCSLNELILKKSMYKIIYGSVEMCV